MALLVPVTNIAIVTSIVTLLRVKEAGRLTGAIARDLTRNPFLLSIAAGLTVNFTGLGPIPVLNELAEILRAAALPIVPLCVGANIRGREMAISARPIGLSVLVKLLFFHWRSWLPLSPSVWIPRRRWLRSFLEAIQRQPLRFHLRAQWSAMHQPWRLS